MNHFAVIIQALGPWSVGQHPWRILLEQSALVDGNWHIYGEDAGVLLNVVTYTVFIPLGS